VRLYLFSFFFPRCAAHRELPFFPYTTLFRSRIKLVVFVPAGDLEKVSRAMFDAGAGVIGEYRECSFHMAGRGTFFGSEASHPTRSEEHTSELQSRFDLVCRLLLEKKKKKNPNPKLPTDYKRTSSTYPVYALSFVEYTQPHENTLTHASQAIHSIFVFQRHSALLDH